MENNGSIISREKIDQVATWVGSTVSSAFFSSLERFSCVNVTTADPVDDDEDDYSTTSGTPTASTAPTSTTALAAAAAATTTNSPSVQANGQNSNDVSNLPV